MGWKVSGATNLPLGDREREWDQDEARKRIFHWAGWEDHPQPAKARKAFFAYDDATPTNLTSYKLPFADVIGEELKAIPRGLFAVAQLLRGARDGVDIPESILRAVRRKVTVYYRKMEEKPPWEDDGGRLQKTMPGKLTPAKRSKAQRAARNAAHTRARRGTRRAARRNNTPQNRKKRIRAARTAVRTRQAHRN